MRSAPRIAWPQGKRFAFTVFDDTDGATVENVQGVYAFLADQGFLTTKSCWPLRGTGQAWYAGETCEEPHYLKWLQELQARGFEIGYHLATFHTSPREAVLRSLERFRECFGHDPSAAANHAGCDDSMYWGSRRVSGIRRLIYNGATRFRNHNRFRGDVEGDELYWGDVCRQRVRFFRNFTFPEINTLRCCPFMPYHDPQRPCVNYWFASTDGHDVDQYVRCLGESNQDRLEAEGGACIMYTHFASGFSNQGRPHVEFERLMKRLAQKNGWFVPVSKLLEYLLAQSGGHVITPAERRTLEWQWLWGKIRLGGTT